MGHGSMHQEFLDFDGPNRAKQSELDILKILISVGKGCTAAILLNNYELSDLPGDLRTLLFDSLVFLVYAFLSV
ncbi:hypothetical protein PanWU01x14_103090 [Parasponia andersonii]|uniref:Uncharacterized protein n=1 Tax=Parasponia andersonii TaxID=3476 RepID=A0A2P5D2H0_PARAD|nr:hypothetical protein PanWU01x14_103090 [Parasponia andersonii]